MCCEGCGFHILLLSSEYWALKPELCSDNLLINCKQWPSTSRHKMAPAGRQLYFSIAGQKHSDFNQPTFTISFIPTYFCSRQSEVMLPSDVRYDTRQLSSDQESCNKMLSSLEVPVNQSDFRIQLIAAAPGSGSKWCRTSISLLTGELVHQLRKNYWKIDLF